MREKLSPSKKVLFFLFLFVLLGTCALLVYYKIKLKISDNEDTVVTTQNADKATGTRDKLDIGVEKKTNIATNKTFYYLLVNLNNLTLDKTTGDALGNFYFSNDPNKNSIKVRISNTDGNFYIGNFPNGFYVYDSTWKMESWEKLNSLARPGIKVQLRSIYDLNNSEEVKIVKQIDAIFKSIESSTNKKVNIPDNFEFNASAIGFSDK